MHTRIFRHTSAIYTCRHTYTQTHVLTYIYTETHAFTNAQTCKHAHTCWLACPHTGCTHTQTCLYTEHMHLDTHLPRETHAYMSAQTHTGVHTLCQSFKQWIWRICSLSWVGQILDGSRVMIITQDWWYRVTATISGSPGWSISDLRLTSYIPSTNLSIFFFPFPCSLFLPYPCFCFLSFNFHLLPVMYTGTFSLLKHQHGPDSTNLPFCISCLVTTQFLSNDDGDQCRVEPASPNLTCSCTAGVGKEPWCPSPEYRLSTFWNTIFLAIA